VPLALRHLVLGHPKAFGQRDFNLIFIRATFGLAGRAAHYEFAWRAPAEFDSGCLSLLTCLRAIKGRSNLRPGRTSHQPYRFWLPATACTGCDQEK
jgi:hypothetical protein